MFVTRVVDRRLGCSSIVSPNAKELYATRSTMICRSRLLGSLFILAYDLLKRAVEREERKQKTGERKAEKYALVGPLSLAIEVTNPCRMIEWRDSLRAVKATRIAPEKAIATASKLPRPSLEDPYRAATAGRKRSIESAGLQRTITREVAAHGEQRADNV